MNAIAKSLIGGLILMTFLAAIITVTMWLMGHIVAAAIIGTGIAALLILILVLITARVTRHQTISTMQAGADIALRAQASNDAWDVRKTKVIGDAMREGVKFGQRQPLNGSPALPPLLPQSTDPNVVEANFVIAGLDDEDITYNSEKVRN